MLNRVYSEAAVEVLDILDHTDIEDVQKIPSKFIEFLKANAAKDYTPDLDHSKSMSEMNIKEETKGILGTIYRNWWCSKEEKENYERIIKQKETDYQEEIREKYNPDDIFKSKNTQPMQNEIIEETKEEASQLALTQYKENIFVRFINKIKKLFSRGNA